MDINSWRMSWLWSTPIRWVVSGFLSRLDRVFNLDFEAYVLLFAELFNCDSRCQLLSLQMSTHQVAAQPEGNRCDACRSP